MSDLDGLIPPMDLRKPKWFDSMDPDKPSYDYDTGPDGHRDCDHAYDYCQYTPHNRFVPKKRET